MSINQDFFQLVIRGELKPTSLEEARVTHNQTAGDPQGVAAARGLGDLSHNVFVPLADAGSAATEVLFLDTWNSIAGLEKFFSDPQVQAGGAMMFKQRDPVVWTLSDMAGFSLHAPASRRERFVGLVRGTVKSREKARAAFDAIYHETVNAARMLGQVSHQVFYRLVPPGESASLELIGIDIWMDAEGMTKYYKEPKHLAPLADVFAGPPVTSVWKQPAGSWIEW